MTNCLARKRNSRVRLRQNLNFPNTHDEERKFKDQEDEGGFLASGFFTNGVATVAIAWNVMQCRLDFFSSRTRKE